MFNNERIERLEKQVNELNREVAPTSRYYDTPTLKSEVAMLRTKIEALAEYLGVTQEWEEPKLGKLVYKKKIPQTRPQTRTPNPH